MNVSILQKESPVLREKARPVPLERIGESEIKKILSDMKEALMGESDGVAIAAPQIGVPYRIFIVSGKVFEDVSDDDMTVFINPELIKHSRQKERMEEGCLSVRWLYGYVKRYKQATVAAYDEKGEAFQMGASGLLSQIFQHEIDHLNGILFIDKAENIQEMPPQDNGSESTHNE